MPVPEPLDYERNASARPIGESFSAVSGAICLVAAGLYAIAGAVLIGLSLMAQASNAGYPPDPIITYGGGLLFTLSAVLLVAGFLRWRSRV
jgi:hypothetical protein